MMRTLLFLLLISSTQFVQCQTARPADSEKEINTVLEAWYKAASNADFDGYFGLMTADSYFLGTDATENWNYQEFKAYSKPHFDKGKAWSFSTLERNIFVKDEESTAWFDEHLDTQMGICRGSGVVKKVDGHWKIKHYVLSIAVPNENVSELTVLKKDWDSLQMFLMRKKNKI